MDIAREDAGAATVFTTQLLVHIVRNMAYNGQYPAAIDNIRETVEHCAASMPRQEAVFRSLGNSFEEAVRTGLSQRSGE